MRHPCQFKKFSKDGPRVESLLLPAVFLVGINPTGKIHRKKYFQLFPLHYYPSSITSVIVMTKPRINRLGELQLKILKVLWDRSEATVAEVHETLSAETDFAYTTIATMLRKMEVRGLVKHRAEERKFLYRAQVKAEDVTRKMSAHFVERMFEGSLADMVTHLLSTHEVSREELDRISKLIAARKKKL